MEGAIAQRGFKILTTHVSSLPEPAGRNIHADDAALKTAVAEVMARQRAIGLDVINEGEFTKGGDWLSYMLKTASTVSIRARRRPVSRCCCRAATARSSSTFTATPASAAHCTTAPARADYARAGRCTSARGRSPISGVAALAHEIGMLRAVAARNEDVFLTTTAPASLEALPRERVLQDATRNIVFALAEAMRVEYEGIASAGFMVQVDDAWLARACGIASASAMGLEAYPRSAALMRVEALNHALRNVPEDRIRYHLCWGSWHGPHVHRPGNGLHLVDIMLKVKAQAYPDRGGQRPPRA